MQFKHSHTRRAFTLIELLVVVLIIGILSAVALPQYQVAVEKARSAEALTMLKNAHNAHEIALLENGDRVGDLPVARDILDWSNGTWDDAGWHFCTKNFVYEFAPPDIYAYRSNDIQANCSYSSELYSIGLGFPRFGGDVACWASTNVGYKVCSGLVSQGYELIDER